MIEIRSGTLSGMTLTGGITRPVEVPPERSSHRVSRAPFWLLVMSTACGALAGAWQAWVVHRGLADDAYITLATARNVATHGCWCVTPDLWSNTATSPLWVALLAAGMLAAPPVVALAGWLTVLTAATSLAVTVVARRCRWAWWAGPLVAVGLAASPVMQSSVGLESALAVTLLAALVLAAVDNRPWMAGIVCGLLVLTRPDLAVVAVVAAVWWRRDALRVALAAALTVVPWLTLSLAWFGTLVPETLAWKTTQPGLGYHSIATAWPMLLAIYPLPTILALAALGAGILVGAWWLVTRPRHPVTMLAVCGGAHLAALLALGVGAGWMWYLAPATGVAIMLLAFTAARRPGETLWLPPVALVAAGLLYTAGHDWRTQGGPFMANGALTDQYAAIAAAVPDGATLETAHGEVGALAFFCGDRCRVVDPLSDPGRIAPVVAGTLAERPVLRLLYPAWHPQVATPASFYTVAGDTGFPTWSGFGGWGHIALVKR